MSDRASVMALDAWRKKAQDGEAPTDVVLLKQFVPDQVKASKDSREVTFVISTGAVDREGDTIAVDGWHVDNYLKNPVVLWAHRYDQLPVAKAASVVKSAGQLRATAEFPEPGINPMADTVYEMLKGGFLRATSVGFRPIKSVHNEERAGFFPMDFIEQELLEFSVVPVPANPEALMELARGITGAIGAGIDVSPIERAIELAKSAMQPVRKDVASPIEKAETEPADQIAKSGRTFSAANERVIRETHDYCERAVAHMKDLLAQVEEAVEDEDDDKGAAPPIEKAADAPPFATELAYVLSREELKASMEAAVSAAVSAVERAA